MRTIVIGVVLGLMGFVGAAGAQERVPDEEAQKIAARLADRAKEAGELPLRTDVDPGRPSGIRSGDYGALAIPDRSLTEDAILKAGEGLTPVGQLWFRGLAPVVEGRPTPDDKLRLVTATVKDEEISLVLCVLAVRKGSEGSPELVVLGKGKEPLRVLPLARSDAEPTPPIALDGRKVDDESGELAIRVLGKYRATLIVMAREL